MLESKCRDAVISYREKNRYLIFCRSNFECDKSSEVMSAS